MICSLFNFCPQSAQSRRHGGWGLSWAYTPKTKLQAPKLKYKETP